jgi:hypothetical protein
MELSDQAKIDWGGTGSRQADLGDGTAEVSYIGGMRLGGFNATWPLVRLDLFPTGIRMHSSIRLLRSMIPRWEARFEELQEVQAVGRIQLLTTGVRLRTGGADSWIIFWTAHRSQVLETIKSFDVAVDPAPRRLYLLNPGR